MSGLRTVSVGGFCGLLSLSIASVASAQAQAQAQAPAAEPAASEEAAGDATERAPEVTAADLQKLQNQQQKTDAELQKLRQELAQEQAARSADMQKLTAQLQAERKAAKAEAQAPQPTNLSDHGSRLPAHETVRGDHDVSPRPGNAPLDPAYKGFIPLFEGKTWIKFGGYAKVDALVDSTRMGNPNKFATSSIPVTGDANFGSPQQFNLHAKQSRLNFEVRTPTELGSVRFVYENDFYGDGTGPEMAYNLRHLYVQFANITVGQTWTTFFDADAIPDTLDFAGPGVQAILRQPQVRYTFSPIRESLHVAVAVEEPKSDLTLGTGEQERRLAPDVTGNARWEGSLGHVQVGAVGRVLSYDTGTASGSSAFGYGLSASGKFSLWKKNTISASAVYGDGIGRYMQDLGASQAGFVDGNGDVQTTKAWGFFVGVRHFWLENLSSQVTYGYLEVDGTAELGQGSYDHTHYGQGNLVWSPTEAMALGGEFLYGQKTVFDGSTGEALRGMMSVKYKLN